MANYTSADAVKATLGADYGPLQDGAEAVSLEPFIAAAHAIVLRVKACAIRKNKPLTTEELELVERWLSAHCYVQMDQNYSSKSTGGASASYMGQVGMGIEGSKYGLMALRLDYSGCLTNIDKRQVATMTWLGRPPSEQVDYQDRD